MTSGIYTITSPSGGQYVGSAVDLAARWRVHRHHLARGTHHARALQGAYRKYGPEQLTFAPLLICRRVDLLMYEQRAIDVLRPRYNGRAIAASQLGTTHTEASKAKNAAAHRGKTHTPEACAAISARLKGNTYMLGKSMPVAVREKISAALKGRTPYAGASERLRNANLGRKKPAEEIARRQATRYGRA